MPDKVIAYDCELLAEEVEAMLFGGEFPPETRAEAIVTALLAYGMRVGEA